MSEPNAGSDLAGLPTRAVARRRPLRRQRPEGLDVATPWSPQKCFCYVRTDPDVPKHKGISAADHRHGHARASRCARCATSPARPSSPRCSSPTSSCPRENLVGELNDGWRITHGLARPRARRPVGGGRRPRLERAIDGLVGAGAGGAASTDDPVVRRQHRRRLRAGRERCGRSATRASPSFAQGSSAPEHSYMKLATSELRQGALRARHGAAGPVRRGGRPRARRGARPLVARVLR